MANAVWTGSPVITNNGDGTFRVQMGPWGFDYSLQQITDILNGLHKDPDLLIGAFIDYLLRNNVALNFSAMKTALEAAIFKW